MALTVKSLITTLHTLLPVVSKLLHLAAAVTSSEGERLMMEALVDSSHGGRRTVLQFTKMLAVIALPASSLTCIAYYLSASHCRENSDIGMQLPDADFLIECKILGEISRYVSVDCCIG